MGICSVPLFKVLHALYILTVTMYCYFSVPDLARLGAPVTVALPEHFAVPGVDDAHGLVLGSRREQ